MIMERNFAPVIVFSFSKKECEAYAMQMAKLDFNSGKIKIVVTLYLYFITMCVINFSKKSIILKLYFIAEEKPLVEEVFRNAMDVLSDEDKQLPQVIKLLREQIFLNYSKNLNKDGNIKFIKIVGMAIKTDMLHIYMV